MRIQINKQSGTKIVTLIKQNYHNYSENKMISNKMKEYLEGVLSGKIRIRDNPRKHRTYIGRMRKMIDSSIENLEWLSREYPELLRDKEWELNNDVEDKRRAKALLRAVALFQSETLFGKQSTLVKLLQELYPRFQIELVKKKEIFEIKKGE